MYVHTASQFWTTDPLGAPTVEVHQTNGHGFWVLVFSASGGARFCLESFAEKEYLLTLMKISNNCWIGMGEWQKRSFLSAKTVAVYFFACRLLSVWVLSMQWVFLNVNEVMKCLATNNLREGRIYWKGIKNRSLWEIFQKLACIAWNVFS